MLQRGGNPDYRERLETEGGNAKEITQGKHFPKATGKMRWLIIVSFTISRVQRLEF